MIDLKLLSSELKRDEGFKDTVYNCSAGKLTIGYGWNVEDNPMPESIAEKMLEHHIAQSLAQCERWPWFFNLDGARQRVIINMVFNIGWNGLSGFRRMIQAIEDKNYSLAADEMMDSLWARQVGQRAVRLEEIMRNG